MDCFQLFGICGYSFRYVHLIHIAAHLLSDADRKSRGYPLAWSKKLQKERKAPLGKQIPTEDMHSS